MLHIRTSGQRNAKCKMQNAKCKMQNAKCKMQNAECKMQNAECKMQNAECKMQNAKCRMQNAELVFNSQLSTKFKLMRARRTRKSLRSITTPPQKLEMSEGILC